MSIPFSILDLAPVTEGGTIAESFGHSAELAKLAETLGYNRIWYAEHHNIASVASSATSVLIAHIAANTNHIRVGSGGVMLPNHAPLLIAEQFGTLAELHPGRIDLGIGRAPGGDMAVIRALRKDKPRSQDTFPSDVQELIHYLAIPDPANPANVRAIPGAGTEVPVWILGSSLYGAQLAAYLGLPYAFASHFAPSYLEEAAAVYRRDFQPSKHLSEPYFMMSCNVYAADTNAEAQYQFSTLKQAFVGIVTNQRTLIKPPVKNYQAPPEVAPQIDMMLKYSAVGNVETVAQKLSEFQALVQPDEFIISNNFYDNKARLRSTELAMQARDMMS